MSTEVKCPKCGGTSVRKAKRVEWQGQGLKILNMPAVTPRVCEACGQVWEPVAPLWVLVCWIIGALFFIGLALLMVPLSGWNARYLSLYIAPVLAIVKIVNVILRLRSRGLRLIGISRVIAEKK